MELPKPVRYLFSEDALPYEDEYERLIDFKFNHHNIAADGLHDPTHLHPYTHHWIAVDPATRVLGVLQLQRVVTGGFPYPGSTMRITEFVLFGDLPPRAQQRVAYELLETALERLPPGHRLQIYTPLPCKLMDFFPHFEQHRTLQYSSKPSEGMFLFNGWDLAPPCPTEVEALSTREPCTRQGCDKMATIDCAGVRLVCMCLCLPHHSGPLSNLHLLQACGTGYCQTSCVIADMIAHRASGLCADRDLYEHNLISHFEELVADQELVSSQSISQDD